MDQDLMFALCKSIAAARHGMVCGMRYRIKEHRKARGWTQEQLAQMVGTTKGYISQMENGVREPSAETLRSLAAAFGVDAVQMIEPDSEESQSIMNHLAIFQRLSPEDQAAVARIAEKLLPRDGD